MSGRRLTFTAAAVVSLIFVLAMVFVAGASFSVAYAASTTNSVATSGELSGYNEEGALVYTEDAPMTGASYVIDEEVTDTQSGGTESNAAIIYEQTVTISLTGDMLAAVKSSRLSASLVMNGKLDYLISEGTFAYAGYTVRAEGALSGYLKTDYNASDFTDNAMNAAFDGVQIVPVARLALTGDDKNASQITIRLTVNLRATNRNISGSGVSTATVSVDGNLDFGLLFSFEKVPYTIASSGNGTVTLEDGSVIPADSSASGTIGFGNEVSFRAEPAEGSYFASWMQGNTVVASSLLLDYDKAVSIPSGTSYNYTARFQTITVDGGSQFDFPYNGQAQGPRVTANAIVNNFDVVHSYTGRDGTEYNSELQPVAAGSYTYELTVSSRSDGTQVGHVVCDFVISKAQFDVTMNTSQTLAFGYTAAGIDLTRTVTGVPGESPTYDVELLTGDGTAADTASILAVGVHNYIYRFTPNGNFVVNYAVKDVELTITVEDEIVVTGTMLDKSAGRYFTVNKSVVTEMASGGIPDNSAELTDYVAGKELIKIELEAYDSYDANKYYFIGWRVGLYDAATDGYIYAYYTTGQVERAADRSVTSIAGRQLVYYIPSAYDLGTDELRYKYTHAVFEAIYIEDVTTGTASGLTYAFTGRTQNAEPKFSPSTTTYGFGPGEVKYIHAGTSELTSTVPVAIGTHTMVYAVTNNLTKLTVDTHYVDYAITVADVQAVVERASSVGQGYYNETTGWARKMVYTLSVNRLMSGYAEAYYYSLDGGANWVKADGTPSSSNAGLIFVTPEAPEGTAEITEFLFIAVSEAHGVADAESGYKIVAKSSSAVTAKLDNFTPEIVSVSYAGDYDGTYWTKGDVTFTATVRIGGSGAVLRYVVGGAYTTLDGVLGWDSGSDTAIREETVEFTVSADALEGDLIFDTANAVGLSSQYTAATFTVKIDKLEPSLTQTTYPSYNANGWTNTEVTVTLRADEQGGSGVASVVEKSGRLTVTPAQTAGYYTVKLTDNAAYTLSITDNAGNASEFTLQANIDVRDIEYSVMEDLYQAGQWTNADADVGFNVTAGGSGLRLSYSKDGGEYIYPYGTEFTYPEGAESGAVEYTHGLGYSIPAEDGEFDYTFRIENAAGTSVTIPFGKVMFDTVKPVITLLTDLGAYQTEWTSETVRAEFTVSDGGTSLLKEVVSDNGGEVSYDEVTSRYYLIIDKCTVFTVSAADNAGNVTELELQANVDTIEPTLDIKAYIGGGDPEDVSVVPEGSYAEYDFVSWLTADADEPWIRIEFTINLTASGTTLQYSTNRGTTWRALTDTYMPEPGEITGTVSTRTYITNEQNGEYVFRLVTGSGKEIMFYPLGEGGSAYVRIDFTAPRLSSDAFLVGGKEFPLKSEWTSSDALWRFSAEDYSASGTGSGVNEGSIKLLEFDAATDDTAIYDGTATAIEHTLAKEGYFYTYTFTGHNKFLLAFSDNAGNAYKGEIFVPHIDKTSGFEVAVSAKIKEGDVYTDYAPGAWLTATQSVEFAASVTGIDSFGPSGAKLEISWDGGNVWYDSDAAAEGTGFVYSTDADQYRTYVFRVITGAGVYATAEGGFTVYKDGVSPALSASVKFADGSAYTGGWTSEALTAEVSVTVGAAGGILYLGSPADGAELLTVAPNNSGTRVFGYEIENSVNGEITFVFVSNKIADGAAEEASVSVSVSYDNVPVEVSVENVTTGKAGGEWTYSDENGYVTLKPVISVGLSGIAEVSYSYLDENGEWSAYSSPLEADYAVRFAASTSLRYKAVNNAGVAKESEIFELKIDNAVPTLSVSVNGTPIGGSGAYKDWYRSEVNVDFVTTGGASGVTVYYSYRTNGGTESSEWIAVSGNSVTLTDESVAGAKGGSDRYYSFKAVSGAGKATYAGEGAGGTEYYIPIDMNYYTLDIVATVGSKEDVVYAVMSGESDRLRRGETVTVNILPNAGYRFKSYYSSDPDGFSASYAPGDENGKKPIGNNYTVGGADITVFAEFYKEVTLIYSNLRQTLQTQSAVLHVEAEPSESDFYERFDNVKFSVAYDGADALPEGLGAYAIAVSVTGDHAEDYVVVNATETMTVVYFTGSGTEYDPYTVADEDDLKQINTYMYYEDAYATEGDPYAYLGSNRRTAYFLQTGDVALSASFKPLASYGDGYTYAFSGTYNGNGYVVSYPDVYNANNGFALFTKLDGAAIMNLGVEFNLNNTRKLGAGTAIGYIVAEAYSSGIYACYARGNAEITDGDVIAGGIVGKAVDTLITYCFADVKISAKKVSGYVGGIAGCLEGNSYIANSYTVGGVSVTDSYRYSASAIAGTEFVYAGSVAGYCDGMSEYLPAAGNETYYLDKNISFDGSIEAALALGNAATFTDYDKLLYTAAVIDFFAESATKLIDAQPSGRSVTVGELTAMRIDAEKAAYSLEGKGTSEDPFLVDTEEKFSVTEVFPWASYLQTADITLYVRSNYAYAIPFVGNYDGGGHTVFCATGFESDTVSYGGLFAVLGGSLKNLVIRDAAFVYNVTDTVAAGAAAGILTEGASIVNVTVTGTVTVNTEAENTVYAGGIAGYAVGAEITDCVSTVAVYVKAPRAVAGGIIGQADGDASIGYLVSMSALTVDYSKQADVGGVIGAAKGNVVATAALTYLNGSAYASGKTVTRGAGYDATGKLNVAGKDYVNVTSEINLVSGGVTVGSIIGGLYPFEGSGTAFSPFVIDSYRKLLLAGNYMYASFSLAKDIIIGDLNDDGRLDGADGYDYDYAPIGNGATFTGSFDGKNHSIIGLTDSLFAANAGTVRDVYLTVNYKVYAYEEDIPASDEAVGADGVTYTWAKVAEKDADLVFGAVAGVNLAGGKILRVSVAGEISVTLAGQGKAVIGGFVGIDRGGQIIASGMEAAMKVRAVSVEAGGVAGACEDTYGLIDEDNSVQIPGGLDVGGATVRAGLYIGAIKTVYAERPVFAATGTTLKINGADKGNTVYVGYDING